MPWMTRNRKTARVMTDPLAATPHGERRDQLLADLCAAAATLGTTITVLPPHGSDAEPVVIHP